ncbi:MAG: hemolysin family protein [Nanoarchaeota archaeon]|nr:hemolysin family protein [Nanoarchaeota archaeon]
MIELIIVFSIILVIVILSGIISGTEAAILSLSPAKIKEFLKSNKDSRKIQVKGELLFSVKEHLQYYISVLVILNNIINIGGSVLIGYVVTQFFGEVFLGIVTALLTLLIIIFSEVIPKIVGERNSLKVSLSMTRFLVITGSLLRPFVFSIEKVIKILIKQENSENVSKGEIREMAILGTQEGSLDNYEGELIDNIFDLNETSVYDIMVPRHKIVTVQPIYSFDQIIELVKEHGYTRFPVEENFEIIGYIHIKDLFGFTNKPESFKVKDIMRQLVFIPDVMKVVNVEKKLKSSKQHICAIVNEHGEVSGIVTFEDIVEEIFGDISDEHDVEEEKDIVKISDNMYQVKGDCEIVKLNEELDLDIYEDEDYSTLNGYLLHTLERMPNLKEEVVTKEGIFRVIAKDKKRVVKVEFEKKNSLLA